MNIFQRSRQFMTAIALVLVLMLTTAWGATTAKEPPTISPASIAI